MDVGENDSKFSIAKVTSSSLDASVAFKKYEGEHNSLYLKMQHKTLPGTICFALSYKW